MTLQTSGQISLWDIAQEFHPAGGNANVKLEDFYAGGPYVPAGTKNGSGVAIPTSGQISLEDFYGASAEADGPTIMAAFWANRAQCMRCTQSVANGGLSDQTDISYGTTYPGDLSEQNYPQPDGNKYQTRPNYDWYFSASSMAGMSSHSTLVIHANGNHPGASTWYVYYTDSSGNTYYPDNSTFEVLVQGDTGSHNCENLILLLHLTIPVEHIAHVHFEYDATTENDSGSWGGCYVLPAWWDAVVNNPFVTNYSSFTEVTAQPSDYWGALDPGSWMFLISGNLGSDSGGYIYECVGAPAQSTGFQLNYVNWSQWWYNAYAQQIVVNTKTVQLPFDWNVWTSSGVACYGFANYNNTEQGPMVLVTFRKTGVAALPLPTFPTAGAGDGAGGGGGGGGGGGCVAVESHLELGRAHQVLVGSKLTLAHPVTLEESEGHVTYSMEKTQPGYRIVTREGASLRCSATAPIPTRDGTLRFPTELLGEHVPVKRHGVVGYEEITGVEALGPIQIQHISINDQCFWAGEQNDVFILHHNKEDE